MTTISARILALVASGMALRHAARIAGVATSTIVRARRRAGLPALKRGRRAKP